MGKPVLVYYRCLSYCAENLALLNQHFEVVSYDRPGSEKEEILRTATVLCAPLGYPIDASRLEHCPNLRVVLSNTTGIPHIDERLADAKGIVIAALHNEQSFLETITPTAEHAIGLLLAAWRRIPWAHAAACSGKWDRTPWGAPRMLSRMRLGIVGYGRLGRKVARIAEAMGMLADYYDPFVDGGAETLENLAASSDVLSLHAPATPGTVNLISRSILEAMPRGGVVINTARGELLDEDALIDLLESGHLAAAGLDTLRGEYQPDFPTKLVDSRVARYASSHENLVLTPHIGGSTVDAWRETQEYVIRKAIRVLGLS